MEEKGKLMAVLFAGKYNHTLDTKGRIIVPAKFKKNLDETFVVCPGVDKCLYIYPNERWEAFVNELDNLPGTAEIRQLQRQFLANAEECELDKQGRIVIPADLRKIAGLQKEVVFVGVGHKIEIWSKDNYEAANTDVSIDKLVEGLTEYGIRF